MDHSVSPEAASPTSHVKLELGMSLRRSADASPSSSKDGGIGESPLERKEKTDLRSESGSDSRSGEEEKEDKIKAETLQPKESPAFQVNCAC